MHVAEQTAKVEGCPAATGGPDDGSGGNRGSPHFTCRRLRYSISDRMRPRTNGSGSYGISA